MTSLERVVIGRDVTPHYRLRVGVAEGLYCVEARTLFSQLYKMLKFSADDTPRPQFHDALHVTKSSNDKTFQTIQVNMMAWGSVSRCSR